MNIIDTLSTENIDVLMDGDPETTLSLIKESIENNRTYCLLDGKLPDSQIKERISLLKNVRESDLMYITFTSGTTGVPKGVCVKRAAVEKYIDGLLAVLPIDSDSVIANQSPFCFDAYLKSVFTAQRAGGRVVLLKRELFSRPGQLLHTLAENRVNTLMWTSSAYSILAGFFDVSEILEDPVLSEFAANVRLVTFGSERMPLNTLQWLLAAFPTARFFNLYGPTEAVGMSTYYEVNRELNYSTGIPAGVPLPGVKIAIQNGEIFIVSDRLAEGYLGNEELTKKAFPYIEYDGKLVRSFATGDLGHFNRNGELMLDGRKDDLIKRAGYQIKLSELERLAESCEGVNEATACFNEDTGALLLFYTGKVGRADLQQFLFHNLPGPAVPGAIKNVSEFPKLSNGKTDRRSLFNGRT